MKARLALFVGILCISIFPILIKLELSSGFIAAFYRMGIATLVIVPFTIASKKLHIPNTRLLGLSALSGLFFASDVALWNVSIMESNATQATLLVNLAPVWVGIGSLLFLKVKPHRNFWIGVGIALLGLIFMIGVKRVSHFDFDRGFILAIISGMFYAGYILLSKESMKKMDVMSFLSVSLVSSTVFLFFICLFTKQNFLFHSQNAWFSFFVQGIICQVLAWVLISFALKNMRATRVSLSLLSQAFFSAIFARFFLNEQITMQLIVGGLIVLVGIAFTFKEN